MPNAKAYAAASATSPLASDTIPRCAIRPNATSRSRFFFCGVCHSDLHQVRNECGAMSCPRSTLASRPR